VELLKAVALLETLVERTVETRRRLAEERRQRRMKT
jgi:hypothetical protein